MTIAADTNRTKSRHELLSELEKLGVNTGYFDSLSIDAIQGLLDGIRKLASKASNKRGRPRSARSCNPILSQSDKEIVLQLLSTSGHVSSLALSRKLGIPRSTIHRKKTRLENSIIDANFTLKLEKLGWRSITMFIGVSNGNANLMGRKILETEEMVSWVKRTGGDNGIDLMLDVVFKSRDEFVSLLDRMKSLEGVARISWVESTGLIGRNNKYYEKVIASL